MKQLTNSVYQISLGSVNAFLIEDNGLTLVDTGLPGTADKLLTAIRQGGKKPETINRIILTHWHPDHAGNAAELKQRLNARLYAHIDEASILEQGGGSRPRYLTPGPVHWLVFTLFIKNTPGRIMPVIVDELVTDSEVLPIAGGIQIIHTPGHSLGHIALLVEQEGMLIAGDICANVLGLDYSTVNEDIEVGQQSILKAAAFGFDQAVFGHGNPVKTMASQKLKEKFEQSTGYRGKVLKAV